MKKLIISMSLLAGAIMYGGGFRVSLQGVKQLAMAHTSAHAEDASIAFFNPAGISFIPSKLSIATGGFGILNKITYQNANTLESFDTNNPVGTPIYAAVAYKPIENLSVGFSFTTPFGSTIDWGSEWVGREIVHKMQLKSYFFQPMVSVKLAPWASFGASYIYARGEVNWTKSVTQSGGTLEIADEKATGHGFGFGFYFQPNQKWDLSLAFRSPVNMKATHGVATFSLPQSVLANLGLGADSKDNFTATLPLASEYTLGATYKITPKWKISADFNYTGWEDYHQLTLDFEKALVGNSATDKTIQTTPKNFHNTKTFRVGTEYQFNDMIAGRAGWYYDESPYSDENFIPETPSFDTNVATAGIGLTFGGLGIDASAALSFPKVRKVNNTYYNFTGQAKANNPFYFGLGIHYNFN